MKKNCPKINDGFTLIETVIYIAILSIVIGGGIVSAFYIIDSGQKNKIGVNIQAEGNFLLRKIEWAMTGAASISVVSPSRLSIIKDTTTGFPPLQNPLVFSLVGSNLQLTRGAGMATNLNSSNVKVDSVIFTKINGTPAGVTISFTLSAGNPPKSQTFTVTKYLRK